MQIAMQNVMENKNNLMQTCPHCLAPILEYDEIQSDGSVIKVVRCEVGCTRGGKGMSEDLAKLRDDLKKSFMGVFVDTISEEATHLIWLSDWGMEDVDFDELLDPCEPTLIEMAHDIAAAGFTEGCAVVVTFELIYHIDDPDEINYIGISLPLTEAIYGTIEEQSARLRDTPQ